MEFLVHKNGQNIGPLSLAQVNQGLQTGQFSPFDWACTRQAPNWRPLKEVLDSLGSPATPPSQPAPQQGLQVPNLEVPRLPQAPHNMQEAIRRFLNEDQDPAVVERVHARLLQICTPDEGVLYIAVQKKPVVTVSAASVALTTKRVILFRPKSLGLGMTFEDFHWMHVADIHISESILGATLYRARHQWSK